MSARADRIFSLFKAKETAQRTALDTRSRLWTLLAAAACLLPLLLQLESLALPIACIAIGCATVAMSRRHVLPGWLRLLLVLALIGYVLTSMRFSFGRDTGCALLAAMLAVKPAELHGLRDTRSLIGFALFAPFATFLLDQGPASLLLGLLGVILALAALLQLSDLESGESASAGDNIRAHARRFVTVLRLIAIGLPLALAAFWLFPRISAPLWGVPERVVARPGLSDRMAPGEWIDFMADDRPALRVKFFGAAPPTSQMYWRGPVLWDFDGRAWTRPAWPTGLRPAPTTRRKTIWDYEIEVEPTDRRQLVALDLPLSSPLGTTLDFDHSMQAQRTLSSLTRWHLRSAEPQTYQPQLSPEMRALALRLPPGYNPRALSLARQWRRSAGTNDDAIVQRALSWITRDFIYTLDTPLLGHDSVDEFLFEQKRGFCEHFSSAFVVLMRGAGIPARVVTGYAGGYHNPYGDYWLVRNSDAHAWSEVWLSGRGWVRVDPTAAVAPERIYDTLADRAPGVLGSFTGLTPVFDIGDWLRRGWNDLVLGFDATRQQRLLQPLGIDHLDDSALIALFAGVAGLALGWMLWLTTRRERERDPLLRAWHALGARYARLGLAREPHEPASAWAARVARSLPERPQSAQLPALSARFADWRYARHDAHRQGLRDLVHDLRRHRP